MENKYSAHMIVEAALMAALVVVFTLMAAYVPILGTLCIFIAPIPIAVLNIKYNYKIGIATVLISSVLVAIFSGIVTAILPIVMYGPCGLILGVCIRKDRKPLFTAITLIITNIISNVIYYTIYIYALMKKTFLEIANLYIKTMKETMEMSANMYNKVGVDMNSNPLYVQVMNLDIKTLAMLIPAALFLYAVFSSIITYNISRKIFNRLNINISVKPMDKFADWYIDAKLGAVLILIVCLSMFAVKQNVPYADYFMSASYTVFSLIMSISGLSIVDYFLVNKFKMRRVMAAVICVLLVLTNFSLILLSLGITDLIFDIRGKDENSIGSFLRRKLNSKK